jgi:hypothetical protein
MEKGLVDLEKELYELDDIEGDVWRYINKWEKKFWIFVDKNKKKFDWCEDEFEKINSINNGIKFPKDSFRGRIDSYKKLFEKIKEKE